MHRALTDALKWTELVAALDLCRTSMTLALLETEGLARTEAEAPCARLRLLSAEC